MTPLERRIRSRIRAEGPIPVADYMAMAMGDPEDGYYVTRDPLGAAGDFTTAPEISQMFGELIGLWCVVAWRQMGAPKHFLFVELGPGRGTLMADALRAARADSEFMEAMELHLVETSPTLRRIQSENLGRHGPRWHDRLDGVSDLPLLLIANEFFDALAVEQFVRADDGWHRRCVGLEPNGGGLCFVAAAEPVEPDPPIPTAMWDAPVGGICEVTPAARTLARDIGARLVSTGGAALIIDYGPGRSAPGESLQAVADHRYAETLARPGETDLTAHVDFQTLAEDAAAMGAAAHGPLPQGLFLERIGLGVRLQRLLRDATPERAETLRADARRLAGSAEMGTLFKVLALTAPDMAVPAGFEQEAAVS